MILAIDTSMGTAVALVDEDGDAIAIQTDLGTRAHAELIGVFLDAVLAAGRSSALDSGAGADLPKSLGITAVAVGMGPGPYTGLRVGIAAARAAAVGLGVPVIGVASHDAIREGLGLGPEVAVATPAGRRGHYLSADGRTELTHEEPGDAIEPDGVDPVALARVALRQRAAGAPDQSALLYLREPDVAPPARPKRVS